MLKNDLMFYIKTTETCNLNCSHCYTSGKEGRKIYFNPEKVAHWVNQVKDYRPESTAHFEYHGGEPFLAPVSDMWKFWELTKDKWPDSTYGCTSNLVHKLTDEKLEFMDIVLKKRLGTSWDPAIRFDNEKQRILFQNNVALLLDRGYTVKLFVSLTQDVMKMGYLTLLQYVKSLGVQELALERITHDGHARYNNVAPSNLELQHFFLEMHEVMKEHNAREWFDNEFMETVYSKFETGFTKGGTFCRDCEQKLFTINADGSIAGCPNAAPRDYFSHISISAKEVIESPKRCEVIMQELNRDPRCYSCSVYKYCGGDCHQLLWEDDICGAPRMLMKRLDEEINGNIK